MEDISLLLKIITIVWLFICSVQDIKEQQINLVLIGVGFISLFTLSLIENQLLIWERLGGVGLGIFLILLSKITRGQIGIGDGLILSVTGISLGFYLNSILLIYSLFISAVFSIGIMIIKKANRKSTIPFTPFVFIVSLGVVLGE